MANWSVIANGLIPHGYCLSWQPHLLWLHGVSDVLTAVSYYSIQVMLLVFVRRRQDLQFSWIFVLFGVFIMACGATHVMSLWTLWRPDYLAAGIVKAVTAAASVGTALLLFPLLPKALALPGPAQWEAMHRKLKDEVAERSEAEAEVRRLNALLEQRVAARTAELEAANARLAAANEDLRAGEERFRSVVESAPSAILLVGHGGRISLVNAQTEKLFGYPRDELVGQNIEVLVEAHAPDLVLMDLVMPVLDGMTAIRRLRATPGLAALPIIAVSASADATECAASLTAGADAFLPKPFEQERLLERIGALLGLAWIRAEPASTPSLAAKPADAADLVIPPQDEMSVLHQFALAGDMRAIRRQADRLIGLDPRYVPFAEMLRRMATEYRTKVILDLVASHLRKEQIS